MAIWQIVPLVALLATVALSTPEESRMKRQANEGGSGFYEDFIDPYQLDNKFHVSCGTADNKTMRVVYRGDAHRIFSSGPEPCTFEQTETGHYVVENAINYTVCLARQANGLQLYTLDVTVQHKYIHLAGDPRYLISCNYELGGLGLSASQSVENKVKKTPLLIQADNSSQSIVTLTLRDTKNEDIDSVRIGDFVQLVAFFTPVGNEVSFRIWNCMASSNHTGVYVEHAILIEGCGDTTVIKENRGFRTTSMVNDRNETIRIARSVFFRSFALLNGPRVQFTCAYIVRGDDSADGPSCDQAGGRGKRSVPALDRLKREATSNGLPQTQTDVIELLDPSSEPDNVITYAIDRNAIDRNAINRNSKTSRNDIPNIFYKNSMIEHRLRNLRQDNDPGVKSILNQPLVIGLLVTCAILIMVPLIIACCLFLTRTSRVRYVKPTYSSPPPIYLPDSPVLVEKLDARLVR